MGFFTKTKKTTGWLVVSVEGDGISVAHIKHVASAKPAVAFVKFYPTNQSSIPASLEEIAKELHADRYQCAALLATGEYQILSVEAPNVPPEELKTAIRWRLKDMLDYPADEATVDVLDIPIDKNAPVRAHAMYAVAARNSLIAERQALFKQAKIPLRVIDIPDMAQRNISALLEPEGRGIALLSFDAVGGLLTVTYAGELYLTRRIDVTLSQLKQSDENQRNATYDRVTLELQRSLDHLDRQYHFITLAKLVLAPLAEGSMELQAYLATNLYMQVEMLDLDSVLDLAKVPDLKQPDLQQRYFTLLGAALRDEATAA